jgi:DNA-binding NarL/FixJ family response regulator
MPHSPIQIAPQPIHGSAALHVDEGPGTPPRSDFDALLRAPSGSPQPCELAKVSFNGIDCANDILRQEAWPLGRPRRMVMASTSGRSGSMQPLLELLRQQGHGADCDWVTNCHQLVATMQRRETQLLLLDLDMLKLTPILDLLQLRHQFPKVHWILASHTAAPPCVDLVLRFQARGCVNWDDADAITHAIDSVLAGDLWFPRRLMDDLYERLLSELRSAHRRNEPTGTPTTGTLTQREAEVMTLVAEGLTNKEIARRLGVSVNTVKKHLKNAFEKRGMNSRRQARC